MNAARIALDTGSGLKIIQRSALAPDSESHVYLKASLLRLRDANVRTIDRGESEWLTVQFPNQLYRVKFIVSERLSVNVKKAPPSLIDTSWPLSALKREIGSETENCHFSKNTRTFMENFPRSMLLNVRSTNWRRWKGKPSRNKVKRTTVRSRRSSGAGYVCVAKKHYLHSHKRRSLSRCKPAISSYWNTIFTCVHKCNTQTVTRK